MSVSKAVTLFTQARDIRVKIIKESDPAKKAEMEKEFDKLFYEYKILKEGGENV